MAIYTTLTKKDITKIADEFALGDLVSFTGIKNGSVNTHYLIETKRGRYFAKIDEVKSEIEVKQDLNSYFTSESKISHVSNRSRAKPADFISKYRTSASR